jgi:virginiamycin B lyase
VSLLVPAARAAPVGAISQFGIPSAEGQAYVIAPGPDGDMWFTEIRASKIGRVTPGGEVSELATPTPESKPTGIAAGADGNVWFVEYAKSKTVPGRYVFDVFP